MSGEPNAFISMLRELQGGATPAELHSALTTLVEECQNTGRPGKLTITFTLTPKAGQIIVTDDITLRPPKPERAVTVMFPEKNHRLSRRDPRQPRLDGVESEVRQFPAAVGDTDRGGDPQQ